jgi:hypothetical protein
MHPSVICQDIGHTGISRAGKVDLKVGKLVLNRHAEQAGI